MTQAKHLKRVLLTIPNTGAIHPDCVLASIGMLKDSRYRVELSMPIDRPYVNSLNKIAKRVVDEEFDYWVNMDSDNPPKRNPLDLIALDKDIIGLPTPIFVNKKKGEYPFRFNTCDYVKDIQEWSYHGWNPDENPSGLEEVDAVGSGCMVVARRVLLCLKAPFMRQWNEYGIVEKGHDFLFCRRAKEKGFSVWAHFKYPCKHYHNIDMLEVTTAIHEAING